MFTQPRTSTKRNAAQFSALQPPAQPIFNPAPPPQQQQQLQQLQQPFPLPNPFATESSSSAVPPIAPSSGPATTRSLASDPLVEPVSFIGSLYPDLRRPKGTQRPSALARWSEKEEEHHVANDAIIDDTRTTMDIEPSYAQSPTVLVKDEKHMVETLGKMPPEVLEVFENADFYQSAFAARVEPAHGYALVWTKSQALVWSYERSTPHTLPTCFIFPLSTVTFLPPQSQFVPPLPLVALVPPSDSTHEPGLLASSPEGELRYWDAVSLALSSPDRYRGVRLYLNEGETVTALNSIGTGIYIIGTTHSRLLRVTLAPSLACSALTRPVGVFARVGNLLGYRDPEAAGEDTEVSKAVIAIVPGNRVELREVKIAREVYALTRRTLQKWIVSKNTVEKFIMEQDILTPIRDNILSNVGDADPTRDLKVTLLDMDYGREGQIVVLVSYVGNSARGGATSTGAVDEVLWYTLVILELRPGGPWGDEFAVVERIDLKHSSYPDLRPRSNPILALPNGGPAAFVVFPDAIVMRTLFKGVLYEEEVILKNRQSDRVVGLGVDKDRTWNPEIVPTAQVLVVASGSGILKCEMAVEVVRKEMGEGTTQAIDMQARQTLYLKSKLEQAVFFDNKQRNPLSFDLTTEFDGNLNKAALDLSREILESTSKHIPAVMDIKMSLRERLNRLKSIIKYIDANRIMNKLSLDSRYQLCWDAERMAAAIDLWNYQNSVMG
ncbi:hypothetical protein BC937DRAFT_88629 [Endogone sp. FLAS-F59071]|nr:hypothetical protein BC937DRAFT_88629 [Endogone sp. FLAS-F59071]|eukprot:RUS18554.1 hypothetical protein BC937DRAFT_88629 [Endogone sp. FLAS-F59071]